VNGMTDVQHERGELRCSRSRANTLWVELPGTWRLQDEFPSLTGVEQPLEAVPRVRSLTFDTAELTGWDGGLATFLLDLIAVGAQRQIVVDQEGLPSGVRRLLHLSTVVPERQGARRGPYKNPSARGSGRPPSSWWPWRAVYAACSVAAAPPRWDRPRPRRW
jgi:hypothetical protein